MPSIPTNLINVLLFEHCKMLIDTPLFPLLRLPFGPIKEANIGQHMSSTLECIIRLFVQWAMHWKMCLNNTSWAKVYTREFHSQTNFLACKTSTLPVLRWNTQSTVKVVNIQYTHAHTLTTWLINIHRINARTAAQHSLAGECSNLSTKWIKYIEWSAGVSHFKSVVILIESNHFEQPLSILSHSVSSIALEYNLQVLNNKMHFYLNC